jgi:hypothetical protein
VGVDDQQVGLRASMQFGEPGVVVVHLLSAERDDVLLGGQDAGHVGLTVERSTVIERITAVQNPTMPGVDRHTGMPTGVPRQRDEHDAGCDFVEFPGRCEAPPLLAVGGVRDDLRAVRPLAVASAVT